MASIQAASLFAEGGNLSTGLGVLAVEIWSKSPSVLYTFLLMLAAVAARLHFISVHGRQVRSARTCV